MNITKSPTALAEMVSPSFSREGSSLLSPGRKAEDKKRRLLGGDNKNKKKAIKMMSESKKNRILKD